VDSVHTLDGHEVSALRKLKADSTSPFVFVSERGGPLAPDMIARIVERAGEAAKLGFHVHPHMLRHTTAGRPRCHKVAETIGATAPSSGSRPA
jgi:site-specific recombinase XerD